jgi:methanol metabolism-related c-type cytochrome
VNRLTGCDTVPIQFIQTRANDVPWRIRCVSKGYTFSGFRRYHSDCHVCHGPNGEGSSYAPALAQSLKTLSYSDFVAVVTNGRKDVDAANDKVMPSFATNVNVMCFIDDIYVYLRARANNAIPGGRPPSHEDKPEAAKQAETSCTGIK